ncbi:PAS domain S-box protein [Asticcacaulis solisilvae]|uniref:PAS domain S-box protein n=1 Tax=Asticcacaulis solisilvae TaxID=1217274 RepID=UPI003FD8F47D
MLFTSPEQLNVVLGIATGFFLLVSLGLGVLVASKSFKVKQFQDLLFKAERKIDTLERRMFNVLNAVPVALVETDNTGKFTFANKAAHALLGRKDNELIGLRFHSATWGIAFPDGRTIPADMLPIARTLRGQTVKGFQHLIVNHGSHDKILVSVTSMPIMNSNGEVIGSTSAMVEIEATAGEGVDDIAGIWRGHWFAAAAAPFWGLDPKGQILDVNTAALDAFDMKREDVLGQNWAQLFVADADFQTALDYLGDSQDDTTPDHAEAVRLTLKGAEGIERQTLVSAWAVHSHEGGEHGLTVMAIKDDRPILTGTPQPETPMPAPSAASLTDDDAQELEDLRNSERALAALGVGVWQYDPEVDAIIEDEGMRRLIGREEPGGPTLISDEDQGRADAEFTRLLAGDSIALNMDIRVVHKDGREHWITLKGQSTRDADGNRQVFGIAFDSTTFRTGHAEPVIETTGLTEADVEAARAEAAAAARKDFEARLEAAQKAAAEAVEAAKAAAPAQSDVYGWADAPQPVIVKEPDPATVAENETLKAQVQTLQAETEALRAKADAPAPEPVVVIEADATVVAENEQLKAKLELLNAELLDANTVAGNLKREVETLESRPAAEPVVVREPDPAVAAENAQLKARLEKLDAELADAAMAEINLRQKVETLEARPEPVVVDTGVFEDRIATLEAQLKETSDARNELQLQLGEILLAPRMVETTDHRDSRIEELNAALGSAQTESQALAEELRTVKAQRENYLAELRAIAEAPAPKADTSEWEKKLSEAQFEMKKWQAAYDDAQARLNAQPAVDIDALNGRFEELQHSLSQSLAQQAELQQSLQMAQGQHAEMHARVEQLNQALSTARRYETVGRLTGDVAQDFAQMLGVINGALEILARQGGNEQVQRLSEAALAAGRRGERLTRQLQAFQSEDY